MAAERTGFIDVVDVPGAIFSDTAYEDFAIYTETSNQGILIGTIQSNVSSISIRSNITTINGTLNVNGTSAMLLPKGTTLQRPSAPVLGQVRYNADINTFEGFGAGNTWGSLGGVKDTNQDTYISPESYPTSNDDILRFYNSNNETMRIMPTGRIGISNTTPSERLEVSGGNAKFNSNIYVIQNLSVGKSNPTYPLDVYGNAAVDGSVTTTKYVLSRGIQVSTRNTNTYSTTTLPSGVVLGFSNDDNGAVFSIGSNTSANYFKFLAANNEVFRITGSGYIGVNTQTPTEALHVQGNVYATNQFLGNSNDSAGIPSFSFKEDSNTGIFHPSNDAIGFSTNGTEKMRITANGNVGIGNSNPAYPLDITGDLNFTGILRKNGAPYIGSQWSNNSTNVFLLGSNVSIGGSTPAYPLDVTGVIRATSNIYAGVSVGIGNSNPIHPLDVTGNARVTSNIIVGGNETITGSLAVGGTMTNTTASNLYAPIDLGVSGYPVSGCINGSVPVSSSSPFLNEGSLNLGSTATRNMVTFPSIGFSWWTAKFTLEAWVNYTSFTNANAWSSVQSSLFTDDKGPYFSFGPLSSGNLTFFYWNGGNVNITSSTAISLNAWTHVAVSYDGSLIRIFINGVVSGSAAVSGTPDTLFLKSGLQIGLTGTASAAALNASVTNVRLLQGHAIYTSTFTPSTSPLTPASTGTTALLLRVPQQPGTVLVKNIGGASQCSSVQAYPPAAMTANSCYLNGAYGQGTYVATASSIYTNTLMPYFAFDNYSSNNSPWASAVNTYNSSTGAYLGTVTTQDIYGNSYTGEWLQLQLPVPIILSSYSLQAQSGTNKNMPASFNILASKDGVNWQLISSKSGQTWSAVGVINTYTLSHSSAFAYYRIVGYSVSSSTDGSFAIDQWTLYGTQASLTISDDGRLGVGVTNPQQALEVAGNAIVNGNISAGNMGMFRNRIINGDMRIAQRGTSGVNGFASVDRFTLNTGVTTLTQQQITLTSSDAPFANGFRFSWKCSATANNLSGIEPMQNIEGYNIADFMWGTSNGQPVTISYWLKTNLPTGSLIPSSIRNTFSNYSGGTYTTNITINNTGVWQYVSYTVPPPPSGGTWYTTDGIGLQFVIGGYNPGPANGTANTWTTTPSVYLPNSTNVWATSGNYIEFTGVQLEKGNIATPFEFRPYVIELQLCQRYYVTFGRSGSNARLASGNWYSNTGGFVAFQSPVDMRATPSFGYSALGQIVLESISWYNITSLSMLAAESSNKYFLINFNVANSSATYGLVSFIGQGAILNFSAEF